MNKIKAEIIKYSKKLNIKKLSALRSGNISARFKDGFFITPSGKKYSTLKNKDIVFKNTERPTYLISNNNKLLKIKWRPTKFKNDIKYFY